MCNTLIYPVNEKGCQNIKALPVFGALKVVIEIQKRDYLNISFSGLYKVFVKEYAIRSEHAIVKTDFI